MITSPSAADSPAQGRWFSILARASHRLVGALIGDSRRFSLDHRLFNSVSLLNGITNVGGVPGLLLLENPGLLIALNLGFGVIFFGYYYLARFRGRYRPLYWPFVLTILAFLGINIPLNAGSAGGAVWYLIPALVIATVLAPRTRDAVASAVLFSAAAWGILAMEHHWPHLIRPYASAHDRLTDLAGNLVFALVFTGGLVLLLAKTLNAERHHSDRLLLNILPREIADELKRDSRVIPCHYDSATVLFSDFVGFTSIAEHLTPTELVERLDEAFQEFDLLTQSHGLEKIKTIGDAYLAVGGIPRANTTHALDAALAALAMLRATERIRQLREQAGGPAWGIRLGLHTGPLVAGVVGLGKFAYDVWGDTVNTASRIESSGLPGQINVSRATYELLEEFFDCEPRGRIAAKGKGELEMFILKSIRPDLTDDGIVPNQRFHDLRRARQSAVNTTPPSTHPPSVSSSSARRPG